VFFAKANEKIVFASNGFKRVEQYFDVSYSQLVDTHLKDGIRIHYLRVSSEDAQKKMKIFDAGTVSQTLESSEFGILLRVNRERQQYTIWLPVVPQGFSFDKHQRIAMPCKSHLSYQWEINPHVQLNLLEPGQIGDIVSVPYVVLEDPYGQFYNELKSLNDVERRLYRKTDWFFANTPSDLWNYLINGSIYDPRSHKGIDKRHKCQQCAYAWWSYFGFLHKESGKKVYSIMQDEIAYSVLLDMSEEGEWGHGCWSDDIETHARFHLDGIHLLISQFKKTGESIWLEAAELGMTFVFEHLMEQLEDGSLWFLHDTLESENNYVFSHFKSTLFGKTPGNCLCINTHVQALTVLYRLRLLIPEKKIYSEMFENGVRALRKVLDYQPGEAIYRLLTFMLTKKQTRKKAQSIKDKFRNKIDSFILTSINWTVRRKFPRLVFPGGFINRDLTVSSFSDVYHLINLKDLLTLYQQAPFPWLRSYIIDGIAFMHKFLHELDLTNAVERSSYYIEFVDVLYLYNRLIEEVHSDEIDSATKIIFQQTGGYSLDYYASEFVRSDLYDQKR
jgi:hypothetical protein